MAHAAALPGSEGEQMRSSREYALLGIEAVPGRPNDCDGDEAQASTSSPPRAGGPGHLRGPGGRRLAALALGAAAFAGAAALWKRPDGSSLRRGRMNSVEAKDGRDCQDLYAQCGGKAWSGSTCCQQGGLCKKTSDFYSQCVEDPESTVSSTNNEADAAKTCSDAISWDECGSQIHSGMSQVAAHPDWYSGLTAESTFKEFQAYFHYAKKHNCGKPCSPGTCTWIFRFQGCAAWEDWNCHKEDDDGSLEYDCCCKRYHTEANSTTGGAATEEAGDSKATRLSLFCTALMLPNTYEVGLLRHQLTDHDGKYGIFGCDDWAVYSNETVRISPDGHKHGRHSDLMEGSLEAHKGGKFNTVLNTGIFIRYWAKVMSDTRTWKHDWTVKADPDTLFFPERLRRLLTGADGGPLAEKGPEEGRYLNNCPMGLHGPIEVVSRSALRTYKNHSKTCNEGGPRKHGQEDFFIRECFKTLGVERVDAFNLLFEGHWMCNERPSSWHPYRPPCFSPQVAFHPFKTVDAYSHCLSEAMSHPITGPLIPYSKPLSHENEQHA